MYCNCNAVTEVKYDVSSVDSERVRNYSGHLAPSYEPCLVG